MQRRAKGFVWEEYGDIDGYIFYIIKYLSMYACM